MKLIILIGLFFIAANISAQKFSAKVEVTSETVAKNEPIVLTLKINTKADKVIMPKITDFKVLADVGNKKTYSEMVGQDEITVEKVDQSYTCVLVPKYVGKFTIAPFTFIVGNETIKSNEIKIKVEDRKVSWQDSASIAEKYTGFSIGSEATSGVPTKTAIDYNKTDKTLVPKENPVGNGIPSFEITPTKIKYKVVSGEDFVVEYKIYKEAPKAEFTDNVEMAGYDNLKDFTLVDGPARHLKVQSNSTTKVQSGTADLILEAPLKPGIYKIPAMKAKYGDTVISSAEIEVVVE
ncbi:MAG: BatD family protein [Fimbriimonadaceae bacterium]|nr:BatD family protein [Chitinophagales bacterium]